MEEFISKLERGLQADLQYYYLINNVSLALDYLVQNNQIKENKEFLHLLTKLRDKSYKIPLPTWNGINLNDQLEASKIAYTAIEVISEYTILKKTISNKKGPTSI